MAISSIIPSSYGYVLGAVSSMGFLNIYQALLVNKARKDAKIAYPYQLGESQLYATPEQQAGSKEALIFNCTQRAHQNSLESVPFVMLSTLITGLVYPRFAASACAAWVAGRVLYTIGYTTGDPKKRQYGIASSLSQIALIVSAGWTSYRIITEGLL